MPQSNHNLGLDGLRGIAALAVVYLHASLVWSLFAFPATCLAVDFFFMLSGYVLAKVYTTRLRIGMGWHRFMLIRTIRLYPMLFVGIVMGALLMEIAGGIPATTRLLIDAGTLVLLPVGLAFNMTAYPPDIALWSLFFEFVASAVFGLFLWRLSKHAMLICTMMCAAAMTLMAFMSRPYLLIGFDDPIHFALGFVRTAYPFCMGIVLSGLSYRLRSYPIIAVMGLLAAVLFIPVDSPIYIIGLNLVAFPLIVLLAISARVNGAAVLCDWLGRLSYPLYLVHWPILRVLHRAADARQIQASPYLVAAVGMALSVVAAVTVLLIFDEPIRVILRRMVATRRAEA